MFYLYLFRLGDFEIRPENICAMQVEITASDATVNVTATEAPTEIGCR